MNTEVIARLRTWFKNIGHMLDKEAADALEAAQPAGEPVAQRAQNNRGRHDYWDYGETYNGAIMSENLYLGPTAPQVPMTDKEIAGAWISIPDPVALGSKFNGSDAVRDFVRGIEAHHGIGVKP